MTPELINAIGPIIAMAMIGGMVLTGYRMHLKAKGGGNRPLGGDADRLAETLEDLADQVRHLREDVGDLTERIDFAERLLVRGRDPASEEHREQTPV